ncbi:hypothetical protein HK100_006114, partial [Physocladia obscura]
MDNTFKIHKYCVLHGVGGSGKTYAAVKYGYQRMQSGQNVAWLKCDSAANAESSYRDFALGVSRYPANNGRLAAALTLPFHLVMNDIVQNDIGRSFLLILDNVENYKDVEQIVTVHTQAKCEVLITTRYSLTPTNQNQPLESIPVILPSEQACVLFFQSLDVRKISTEDAKKITEACNQLPLRIHVAARYLSKNFTEPVKSYLTAVQKEKAKKVTNPDIYPEVSLSIDSLAKKNSITHQLLLLLSFLDPDVIYIALVKEWCSKAHKLTNIPMLASRKFIPKASDFEVHVLELEDLGLVSQIFQGSALTIH